MAIVATYNFDGCICEIDDSYIASCTPEQLAENKRQFEETVNRLYNEQEVRRIMREMDEAKAKKKADKTTN